MNKKTEIPAPPPLGGGEARSQAANSSPGPGWLASLASLVGEPFQLPRHRRRRRRHVVAHADHMPRAGRPIKAKRLQNACCSRTPTQ
jgi:hypothetical protein